MSTDRRIVSILTAAESQELTTLATAKDDLDIGSTDTSQDARLTRLIKAVSSSIRKHLQRPTMGKERVLEKASGHADASLMLSRIPIVGSIEKVERRAELITDFEIEDRDAGFLFRRNGWEWEPLLGLTISTTIVPRTENPVIEVTYSGGWFLPSFTTTPSVDDFLLPDEIEEAALITVRDWFKRRTVDRSLTAMRAADLALQFSTGANRMGIPVEAIEILADYKLVA